MKTIVRDPVCRMEIEQELAVARRQHEGTTFYFCSSGCADLFDREPKRYWAAPFP